VASSRPPRRLLQEQQLHELHGFLMIVAQGGRGIGPALAEEGEDEVELFHLPHSRIFSSDLAELEQRKRGGGRGSNKHIIVILV
jgi:hypothetical protein